MAHEPGLLGSGHGPDERPWPAAPQGPARRHRGKDTCATLASRSGKGRGVSRAVSGNRFADRQPTLAVSERRGNVPRSLDGFASMWTCAHHDRRDHGAICRDGTDHGPYP